MYIKRDSNGKIAAISQLPDGDINELVDDDLAELHIFLSTIKNSQLLTLEQTDQAMARVMEDVINLMVEQGTLRFTDLPQAAQVKLLSRRELRGQRQGMELLDDGDDLNI